MAPPLLRLDQIKLTFGGTPLLEDASLSVSEGDRIALVGRNGSGKSTLLKIAAGMVEATSGEVFKHPGATVRYLPQVPDMDGFANARAYVEAGLGPTDDPHRVTYLLEHLGLTGEEKPDHLSGGEARRAALARVIAPQPDVLLLDEPTNHLDLEKVRQLEDWLNALPRSVAVVVSSHDRAFLDAVTKRTLFLRAEKSPIFTLPYSQARVALDEIDAADARLFEKDMKTVQQLRRQAAKLNNIGINSGSDLLVIKTKQLKARADKIEQSAKAAHVERSAGKIILNSRGSHAKALVVLDQAEITTPDSRLLFKTGQLWINPGDRIVLLGANGMGKTRLLTLVREAILAPDRAQAGIKATPSLVLGYSDQALSELRPEWTPFETIAKRFDIGDQRTRSLLAGAGMTLEMQAKPLERLSGGQKARLAMLVLRLTNPNFYILDEPTNHLDIEGQEALEVELLRNEAASLIVSHDRSFVRNVGNRFWMIERKKLVEVESPEFFFDAIGS